MIKASRVVRLFEVPPQVRCNYAHAASPEPRAPDHSRTALRPESALLRMECCRLRVKDMDFERGEIVVRDGKGRKDRVTMLPNSLKETLWARGEEPSGPMRPCSVSLVRLRVTRYYLGIDGRTQGLGERCHAS